MEMLQGVWKQHLRPRAVVGYGVKIFLPSPPHYVTRSPGGIDQSVVFYPNSGLVFESLDGTDDMPQFVKYKIRQDVDFTPATYRIRNW